MIEWLNAKVLSTSGFCGDHGLFEGDKTLVRRTRGALCSAAHDAAIGTEGFAYELLNLPDYRRAELLSMESDRHGDLGFPEAVEVGDILPIRENFGAYRSIIPGTSGRLVENYRLLNDLRPGMYFEIEDLSDAQYLEVCDALINAGAGLGDSSLGYIPREFNYVGWDEDEGDVRVWNSGETFGDNAIEVTYDEMFPSEPKMSGTSPTFAVVDEPAMRAPDFLNAALGHMVDRAATYDAADGERSMRKTVDAFNALTGNELTETEGWTFMAVLKIARAHQGAFRSDNFEDLASYAGLAGEAAYQESIK